MKAEISVDAPAGDAEWASFIKSLTPPTPSPHPLLESLITRLRNAGAVSVLHEKAYIDRDFSAAYSAFYSTLFRPYRKYCSRLHFFTSDVSAHLSLGDTDAIVLACEGERENYLGNITLRPLAHAPVSSAHLSASALAREPSQEVTVRSRYSAHALGVEFDVEAMPLTQQDTRTGACAQAAMWMAGRHFYNRHSAPWFSLPDITEIALSPTDSAITRSLPAGSEYLTQDNMVRALRAMGRHPVMYAPDALNDDGPVWQNISPKSMAAAYVDSGIPVIIGLQSAGEGVGHGVVAVGLERDPEKEATALPDGSNTSEMLSHFLVNDDQRGAYCRLPIAAAAKTGEYPFCLETDVVFMLVPLPAKVFIKAETAEIIARSMLFQVSSQRHAIASHALGPEAAWNVEPDFYASVVANGLITRTYLTYGWKYKARTLRNNVSPELKAELLMTQLPRYVWVTEFYVREEVGDLDPCKRRVRAHVVVDATGSQFWESTLVVDVPGLSVVWRFDPSNAAGAPNAVINASLEAAPYWPKIRGELDYGTCGEV